MTNTETAPRRRFHLAIPRWNKEKMWRVWTRWDAPLYMIFVAFGVPLMSYFTTDFQLKLWCAMIWFAVTHLYWWLELQEMIRPVLRYSVVQEENVNSQVKSENFLKNWGGQGAIVIWIIFLAIYAAQHWPNADVTTNARFMLRSIFGSNRLLSYGWIEWLIIVHTILVSRLAVNSFGLLLPILLKAFPRAERIEQEEGEPARRR